MFLKRLFDCGFCENATRWFGFYLTGRQQYVTLYMSHYLCLSKETVEQVEQFDYLVLRASNFLSWESHITKLCQRTHSIISLSNRISLFLPKPVLLRIYKQTILPILDYCSTVWHDCGSTLTRRVELVQNRSMRIILKVGKKTCTQEMRNELKLLTLLNRRRFLDLY